MVLTGEYNKGDIIMQCYKLTNKNNQTYNGMQWGPNVTHSLPSVSRPQLGTKDLIHFYTSPNLAYLVNPIHANYVNPHLWLAEVDRVEVTDGLNCGTFKLTTIKRLPKPGWVDSKHDKLVRVQFAVLCARAVLPIWEVKFPDDDRPRKAIEAAEAWLAEPSEENAGVAKEVAMSARDAAWAASEMFVNRSAGVVVAAAMIALRAADYTNIDFTILADQAVGMIVKK
jgi:hypothetical protein